MSSSRSVRVLVTSTPGLGHLQSLMPVARALTTAGHQVLWATAAQSCDYLSGQGFNVTSAGMDVADRLAAFAPRMPEVLALPPRERRGLYFSGFFADAAAPVMRRDLAPIIDAFDPHLIVHEVAELAAAPMAIARGIPHVTSAFSGTLPDPAVPLLLESLAPLWSDEGAGTPSLQRIAGDLYLHPFPPSLGDAPDIEGIRPIRPHSIRPSDDELPPWLASFGRDRPGVYLTAGTEALGPRAPWTEAFAALGSLPVDVVATVGPFVDPSSLGAIPSNVHVERFVQHGAVLERASIVASHAGAGTLLASASMGLPQLLYPLGADQWENADALARAGAGIVCEPDARTSSHLADAIVRLLHDTAIREAAQRLATEIHAMPTAADHVAEITLLADR